MTSSWNVSWLGEASLATGDCSALTRTLAVDVDADATAARDVAFRARAGRVEAGVDVAAGVVVTVAGTRVGVAAGLVTTLDSLAVVSSLSSDSSVLSLSSLRLRWGLAAALRPVDARTAVAAIVGGAAA